MRREIALGLTQQTLQALRVRVEQRQRLREVGAVLAVLVRREYVRIASSALSGWTFQAGFV